VDSIEGYRDLPVVDDEGEPLGIVRPVRVMRALADHTAHQAATDQLTGVASRARFIEELSVRVERLDSGPGVVIVAFVDLDRLKPVNDLFGHTLGDALLRSVAKRLAAAVGPDDVVGRLGGDEFAVVTSVGSAPNLEIEEFALALGERLRSAVARRDRQLPKKAASHASVGVAFTSSPLVDVEPLLVSADEAMYAAKVAGGDRVRLGGRAAEVGRAVRTDDLMLMYQPVIDVRTGEVTAVEALLRNRGESGLLEFPAERMQQAVRTGSTLALDAWVLSQACADMARWDASSVRLPRRLHVNLAPQTVCEPHFATALLAAIDATGFATERVCLELSECAGVDDLLRAVPQFLALTEAGARLALDDMGATLGALRLLGGSLPIDCVKVDRSVIEGCGLGLAFDGEMLDLVARLADRFAIEVVAEGVETAHEDDAVRRSGIHHIQGFLHSKPLVEADLLLFLDCEEGSRVIPRSALSSVDAPHCEASVS
jgi:diguanylate cyclase (GGDEF)-like protein